MTPRQKQFSHAHLDQKARTEGAANQAQIYGPLLSKVIYLQKHGWVIYKQGLNYRVGTRVRDEPALIALYERVKEREDRSRAQMVEAEGPKPKTKTRRSAGNTSKSGGGNRSSRSGSKPKAARRSVRKSGRTRKG